MNSTVHVGSIYSMYLKGTCILSLLNVVHIFYSLLMQPWAMRLAKCVSTDEYGYNLTTVCIHNSHALLRRGMLEFEENVYLERINT